jgi:hypothetical protein
MQVRRPRRESLLPTTNHRPEGGAPTNSHMAQTCPL